MGVDLESVSRARRRRWNRQAALIPSMELDFLAGDYLAGGRFLSRDNLLHYVGGNNGTRVNESGLIEVMPINLSTYSETFDNAAWTKARSNILPNTIQAPNGLMTASKLFEDTTTNTHYLQNTSTWAMPLNSIVTVSLYLKKAERNNVTVFVHDGTMGRRFGRILDLTARTASNSSPVTWTLVNDSFTDVGNGWLRYSMTVQTSVDTTFGVHLRTINGTDSYLGDGSSGVYVWGIQGQLGSTATAYIPTRPVFTSRASLGTYFDSVGRLRAKGQNLLLRSEEFDNASWVKTNSSISANAVLAPNGTLTADKLIENTGITLQHYTNSALVTRTAGAAVFTASVYAKADTRTFLRIAVGDSTFVSSVLAFYDLTNGTAGTATGTAGWSGTSAIENVGNGWYRCVLTFSTDAATTGTQVRLNLCPDGSTVIYTGDGVSGFYLWGAHLNDGAMPADYLQTSSAAVAAPGRFGYGFDGTSWLYRQLEVEAAGTNLLFNSEQFDNGYWGTTRATISANNITAPSGFATADRLTATETNVNGSSVIHQNTTVSGSQVTFSLFAKRGNATYLLFNTGDGGVNVARQWFNLVTGTVGSATSGGAGWSISRASIESVGNGWYRCVAVVNISGTRFDISIHPAADADASFGTTAGNYGYIWGGQLEASSVPTSYIPTTSAAFTRAADVSTAPASAGMREDFDPVTLAPRGVLIEEARTNLCLRSEEFDNASWSKTGASVLAGTAISPSGAMNADTLVEDTSTGSHRVIQAIVTAAASHTISAYVKAAGRNFAHVRYENAASNVLWAVNIDLTTGETSTSTFGSPTGTSASVVYAGNGWWRCIITVTMAAESSKLAIYSATSLGGVAYTGTGIDAIYIWGAQLEAGAFPTSYIPTTTAAVARTADALRMFEGDIIPWWNNVEGTWTVEHEGAPGLSTGAANTALSYGNAALTSAYILSQAISGSHRIVNFINALDSTNYVPTTTSLTPGQVYKFAGAYIHNDPRAAMNGVLAAADNTFSPISGFTQLAFGSVGNVSQFLNTHLRKAGYFPKRLPNNLLQDLSR